MEFFIVFSIIEICFFKVWKMILIKLDFNLIKWSFYSFVKLN